MLNSFISKYLKDALRNLNASKLRSLLTILGVFVGTGAVVALISGGQIATSHALAQFKTLGTDLLAISVDYGREDKVTNVMTGAMANEAAERISGINEAGVYTNQFTSLSYAGQELKGSVIGVNEALQSILKVSLASGRKIKDLDKAAMHAVVGADLAKRLKKAGAFGIVGNQIQAGDNFYTIVGVAKPWPENIFMFNNINDSMLVPINATFAVNPNVKIRNVIFNLNPGANIEIIKRKLTQFFSARLPDARLFFRSPKELIASMSKSHQTLTILLGLIGTISLIVGGIGVMNIMLVSVSERKREIGVRMAVGATPNDILYLFLTEAVVLTLFGGLLGILAGEMISYSVSTVNEWTFHIYWLPPIIGFFVSVFVGIFFGYYPAYQAAQLDPIETLRAE